MEVGGSSFAVECWIVLFPASLSCIMGASRVLSGLVGVPSTVLFGVTTWRMGSRLMSYRGRRLVAGLRRAVVHLLRGRQRACAGFDAREQGLVANDWRAAVHLLHGKRRARAGALACGWLDVLWWLCRDKRGRRHRDWLRRKWSGGLGCIGLTYRTSTYLRRVSEL
jgi:hypothetical protein